MFMEFPERSVSAYKVTEFAAVGRACDHVLKALGESYLLVRLFRIVYFDSM